MTDAESRKILWSFRSLAVQLSLLTTACVLTAVAAFGAFLARDYVRAVERDILQRMVTTSHQVAGGVSGHILVRDYIAIEKQLLILDPVPGFRDVYIISPEGAIISHVTADGSGFLKAVFARETVNLPPERSAQRMLHGNRLEMWQPIGHDHPIGWVRMVSDLSVFYAEQKRIYARTAVGGLLASLASLTLLFWFLRPRLAALNALTGYARRLSGGTNEKLVVYHGSSDIEALGMSLSQAAARLAADEDLLRRSELQLRTVVENMPVLLNAFDEVNRFIVWNRECERVTGYTAGEVAGNPRALEMLYPDADYRAAMLEEWRRRDPMFRDWALTLTAKDGTKKTIAWSNLSGAFPIPGWSSWSVGVDITQAVENERLKDDFVSTVNHELRTPLSAIHGSLRLLASGVVAPLPESARQLIDVAERNCARLTRLISNVLEIQRLHTSQVALELKAVEVVKLVRDAIEANQPYAALHCVTLALVSAPQAEVLTRADADKLMQVLTNLISNAIKFSPAGAVVQLDVTLTGDRVRIAVRDQGPGIPSDFAEKIFERFARVTGSPAHQVGGSGLGLYISKSIIDHHQGRIEFVNNEGGGATFSVFLPLDRSVRVSAKA